MPLNPDYQIVCTYLRSLNIHFCERWVTESISELRYANPGSSTNEIRKGIYDKWLQTNIRDLKVGSFPPNILSYEKITLTGNYAVQVESMVNSARSGYSELQRIENPGKSENITDGADEETNSKRLLTFLLCDGVQEVQAMEYQSIPAIKLNDSNFLPGFKIIVKGPVVCRKGMLLLKQENVKVYGGKVDSLCETNNLLKLLRCKLGLRENKENVTQPIAETNHPTTQNNQLEELMQNSGGDNNDFDGKMEIDDLLSQNDDILLNLSFEADMENEYNSRGAGIEKPCFQVPKKPRINSSANDVLQGNSSNLQFKSSATDESMGKSLSSVSNIKEIVEAALLNYESMSSSNRSNEIASAMQLSHSDDDIVFVSQNLPKETSHRGPSQDPAKCTQMKMSSYITSFKNSNKELVMTDTSSSCMQAVSAPKTVMTYPFIYLKQITDITLTKPTMFTVKAIILTLKSKISIKNDEFALKASISDGSSTIQVNFSSDTLESILEYSPCEVTSMMSEKTRNSAVGERLKDIFFSAQQKLLSMNCLMEVKFHTDGSTPLVVRLEEIQLEHVNALKARSC